MALGLVQPVTGGITDDFLSQTGNVAVCDVDEVLQRRGVTQVSEVEAEAFSQNLDREKKSTVVQKEDRIMKSHHNSRAECPANKYSEMSQSMIPRSLPRT